MIRRTLALLALAMGIVALAAPASPVGAAPQTIATDPLLVLPGTTPTVTGPALSCPGPGETLYVESPGVAGPVQAPQGEPLAVPLPVPAGATSAVHPLTATCLGYGGASSVVGEGWLVVTAANGVPPGPSVVVVSDPEVTWEQAFSVACGDEWFAPGSEVQVWMYSDPVLLGAFTASATGSMVGQVTMPTGSDLGSHTIVLAGVDTSGRPTFLTVGISVGAAAGQQATTTTTTTAPGATTTVPSGGAAPATTAGTGASGTSGSLPATGGGIGLALPAAGLVGLGSVFAVLARWRERLDRRR